MGSLPIVGVEKAYPGCPTAAAYLEGQRERGIEKFWNVLRRMVRLNPCEYAIKKFREILSHKPWAAEMDHPHFRRYVAAKLGLM